MGKCKWFLFLVLFLVVGFVFAVPAMAKVKGLSLSRGAGAQEVVAKDGFIATKPYFLQVKFVDEDGDGMVEVLKDAGTGDTVYTFRKPIELPKSGDMVEISGRICIHGEKINVKMVQVQVN